MANINQELARFKSAVYGEDVRDALVSSITKMNAESSQAISDASTAQNSATAKAAEAANSATAAANSATAAANSASNAATSASNAATSATNASEHATAAGQYATVANTSKNDAVTAKNAAQTSEANALGYCNRAEAAANSAESDSQSTAADVVTVTGLTSQNQTFYNNTAAKAAEAATSADNAALSESNASASEITANASAGVATEKANLATASATAASTSETNAAASETNAASSASDASDEADRAEAAANRVTGYKEAAEQAAATAEQYYTQTRAIVEGFGGGLDPKGTITFAELPLSPTKGWMYNISDQFTTDARFREGAGIVVPAGSNVYFTADSKWDILAGAYVAGVKGDSELSYRQGLVNITKANIGLANVENKSSSQIRQELTSQDISNALGYTPPSQDTDTHYTTHLYAGNGGAANVAATNGNVKLTVVDDLTIRDSIGIKGQGSAEVTTDANGNVIVTTPTVTQITTNDIDAMFANWS